MQAQRWELSVWRDADRKKGWKRLVWPLARPVLARTRGLPEHDDWNHWWAEKFDSYRFLPSEVGDYLEVGCGPYTNTRLILQERTARRVLCSDPLVRQYVRFRQSWLADAFRDGRAEIDDHPAEELDLPDWSLEVVVMINVLDHVYDADLALANAARLVRPNGFLIFGQDLIDEDDRFHDEDVGHPIALTEADVRPHLATFAPVLDRVLPREEGRNPDAHGATLIYAGRKLAEMA